MEALDDRNLLEIRPLEPPRTLREKLPLDDRAAASVAAGRQAIRDLLHGRDERRLLAVVGPCSIHDPAAALEYGGRLRDLALELESELVIVMRTYFEKPRTTLGWKGLINDPHLDGSCHVETGWHASCCSI
jgi:3-deoxy-7-phosphoheptulonate synthase